MTGKHYPEEFKIEAVKQVTERGHRFVDVAQRLGITSKILRNWVKKYDQPQENVQALTDQQNELRRLKAELKRVTEERDILKEAAVYFASESKKSTHS